MIVGDVFTRGLRRKERKWFWTSVSLSTSYDIRHNNITYVILIYLSPQLDNGGKLLDTTMRNRRKISRTSNKSSRSKTTCRKLQPKTKPSSRNPRNIPISSKQIHPTHQRTRHRNKRHKRDTTPHKRDDKPLRKRTTNKNTTPNTLLPNMHNNPQKRPNVPVLPKNRPKNQNRRMQILPNLRPIL